MHFSCIESMFQDGVYLIDTSEGSVKDFDEAVPFLNSQSIL